MALPPTAAAGAAARCSFVRAFVVTGGNGLVSEELGLQGLASDATDMGKAGRSGDVEGEWGEDLLSSNPASPCSQSSGGMAATAPSTTPWLTPLSVLVGGGRDSFRSGERECCAPRPPRMLRPTWCRSVVACVRMVDPSRAMEADTCDTASTTLASLRRASASMADALGEPVCASPPPCCCRSLRRWCSSSHASARRGVLAASPADRRRCLLRLAPASSVPRRERDTRAGLLAPPPPPPPLPLAARAWPWA